MLASRITIDRSLPTSLQTQIRQAIASAIVSSLVPHDERLPSIRKLAKTLNVSVNTVALAYDTLLHEGFITSRERSGYYVNAEAFSNRDADISVDDVRRSKINFADHFKGKSYNLPRIMKPADCLTRFKYPFVGGMVDPKIFPLSAWRECLRDSVSVSQLNAWTGDFTQFDDPLLVDQVLKNVLVPRGILATPEELLITVGGQEALYCTVKLLAQPGGTLGMEVPSYPEVANIAKMENVSIVPLGMDSEGLIADEKATACNCLYVTTTLQYPTNITMSFERRRQLIAATEKTGTFIIEDDYEAETTFAEEALPALKALDRFGNVAYVGSLTKSLMPGLRIGFLVGHRDFIAEARALRHHILRYPPVNNQHATALFMQRGYFERFISKLRREYRNRSEIVAEQVEKHLGPHVQETRLGGSGCWVRFDDDIDTGRLQELVAEDNVYFEEASPFFALSDTRRNCARIGYSCISPDMIPEGIRRIAARLDEARVTPV